MRNEYFSNIIWRLRGRKGAEVEALKQFIRDESGAAAIEYGVIAAGISVAIIAVVNWVTVENDLHNHHLQPGGGG
jgi:Flp pilus assembly pilin Flp